MSFLDRNFPFLFQSRPIQKTGKDNPGKFPITPENITHDLGCKVSPYTLQTLHKIQGDRIGCNAYAVRFLGFLDVNLHFTLYTVYTQYFSIVKKDRFLVYPKRKYIPISD
jgi:hypothetical protein